MKNIKKLFFALTAILCLQQPCHAGFMDTLSSYGSSALQWIQQNPRITGLFATIFTAQTVYNYRQSKTIKKQNEDFKDSELGKVIEAQKKTIENLKIDLQPLIEKDNQLQELEEQTNESQSKLAQLTQKITEAQNNLTRLNNQTSALQKKAIKLNIAHELVKNHVDLAQLFELIETLESPEKNPTKAFIDDLFKETTKIRIRYFSNDPQHKARIIGLEMEIESEDLERDAFTTYRFKQNPQRSPMNKALIISLLLKNLNGHNNNQMIVDMDNSIIESPTSFLEAASNYVWSPKAKEGFGIIPIKEKRILTLPYLPPLQGGFIDHDLVHNPASKASPALKNLSKNTIVFQPVYYPKK